MSEETLSFEEALAELEATVAKLEAGGLTLEETLALFERGQRLAALCEKALSEAEVRLETLQVGSETGLGAVEE
jgi:exodeoxyribonuclease VII small subunit